MAVTFGIGQRDLDQMLNPVTVHGPGQGIGGGQFMQMFVGSGQSLLLQLQAFIQSGYFMG